MLTDNRNRALVHALCNHLSLDQKLFPSEDIARSDIKTLFSTIRQQLGSNIPLKNEAEVMRWVDYAGTMLSELEDFHATLSGLNEELVTKSVLLGYGLRPSEADIVVYSALHSSASRLSEADLKKYPNVLRWVDYIQSTEDFGGLMVPIVVTKPEFEGFSSLHVDKIAADQSSKKVSHNSKDVGKLEKSAISDNIVAESNEKSSRNEPTIDSKTKIKDTEEKKKQPAFTPAPVEKESSGKDAECSVSILNIQVGLIRKAWKHPSADSLLVEEIDLGDGNLRQVVSGLAKYCNPEDLTNRRVALITNVKPGKLRDVMSAGLVLCASSEDHTIVDPLIPPEGSTIGERISFTGYDGKPEDVLNPKKKQLEKITPHLYTDDKGVATYKGVPFMTSAGPCTSSIPKASIK